MLWRRLWYWRFRRVVAATTSPMRTRGFRIPGSGDMMRFVVWTYPLFLILFFAFGPVSPIPGLGSADHPEARIPWWVFGFVVAALGYLAVYPWRYGIWLTQNYLVIRSWFRVHRIARQELQWVDVHDYWGMMERLVALFGPEMLVLGLKSSSSNEITVKEFRGTMSGALQIRFTVYATRRWQKKAE